MLLFDCFDEFYDTVASQDESTDSFGWKRVPINFWTSHSKKRKINFPVDDSREKDSDDRREEDGTGRSTRRVAASDHHEEDFYIGAKCIIFLNYSYSLPCIILLTSMLTGRFAAALSHLESYGLVKLSPNGAQINRLIFAWDVTK
jgi:hypothetical protein